MIKQFLYYATAFGFFGLWSPGVKLRPEKHGAFCLLIRVPFGKSRKEVLKMLTFLDARRVKMWKGMSTDQVPFDHYLSVTSWMTDESPDAFLDDLNTEDSSTGHFFIITDTPTLKDIQKRCTKEGWEFYVHLSRGDSLDRLESSLEHWRRHAVTSAIIEHIRDNAEARECASCGHQNHQRAAFGMLCAECGWSLYNRFDVEAMRAWIAKDKPVKVIMRSNPPLSDLKDAA